MLISRGGKYYVRDLGFVHASRLKLDLKTEAQIHEDCVVDIGKIVHYHFDKLSHFERPSREADAEFVVMR